ncbi:hypothetical protein GCM10011411_12490 [Aurantiacibacter arachoides]|nr:hypothetical protein GCM10011411_12490 [Aurantiacibacter arachoides]
MDGYEEGLVTRWFGRFVRGWSLRRAKIAFLVSTPLYACAVLYTHLFEWTVGFNEGLAFVTSASTLTAIIAFFSRRIPDFDF